MHEMMGDMTGMAGGMMIVMMVFWIALLVLIVVSIFYMVRQMRGGANGSGRSEESPMEILQKRYAKGEIGKKEFEAMKNDLM